MSDHSVRIGGASAFFTDSVTAVPQLLTAKSLDYLVFDYMAEGIMAMYARLKMSDPDRGYSDEFLDVHVGPYLRQIADRGIKVVANAGGVNPVALARATQALIASQGLDLRVAAIHGDNLVHDIGSFAQSRDMFTEAPFPENIISANAYFGAFPIAEALARGADIVVTGRVVDSATTLGILIHEFGWTSSDHDLLAAGTLAGHILECSVQTTGGTFTDWEDVPDWENIGYPIAECRSDGSFVLGKPDGTGGLVSIGTVAEQLLYEVSDPQAYFVPDVVCDWSDVRIAQIGQDRVHVSGARGYPPTDSYKVCVMADDGWRATVVQPIIGIEADRKAKRQADAIFSRTSRLLRERNLAPFTATHSLLLGSEASFGPHARPGGGREAILKMVVDHEEAAGAGLFLRENASTISAMSVGTSIPIANSLAPKAKLFSFLLSKEACEPAIWMDGTSVPAPVPVTGGFAAEMIERPPLPDMPRVETAGHVPLIALAWGRSGDKGELFNVAIIAREPQFLDWIRATMTEEAVAEWFAHLTAPKPALVKRYEAPGFNALNFVIENGLRGGIVGSPVLDSAAKGMAQMILEMPIRVPAEIVDMVRRLGRQGDA